MTRQPARILMLLAIATIVGSVHAGTLLTDGVIVDRLSGRAYVMQPGGGARAVSLIDGRTVWEVSHGSRPVLLHDGVLTLQVDREDSVLELVRVAAVDGTVRGRQVVPLPAGVPVAIDDSRRTGFTLRPVSAGIPLLEWQWTGQTVTDWVDDRGLLGFDGKLFAPIARDDSRVPDRTLPESVGQGLDPRGTQTFVSDSYWVLARREVTEGGDRISVRTSNGSVVLPPTGARLRSLSADGRHLLASERLDVGRYRWEIYDVASGLAIATFEHSRPAHRFLIAGRFALVVAPAESRIIGDAWSERMDRLEAIDFAGGAGEWSVPLRDTRYKGEAIPGAGMATDDGRSRPTARRARPTVDPATRVPGRETEATRAAASAAPNQQVPWQAQGPAPITEGQVNNIAPNDPVVGAVRQMLPHPSDANVVFQTPPRRAPTGSR